MPDPIRVAWLINSPGPNTSDFFDALAAEPGCDLEVLYCARDHPKWGGSFALSGGHRHRFLWNANPRPGRLPSLHLNPGIVPPMWGDRYDIAVVSGTAYPTAAAAMLVRRLRRRPYAVWAEMVNRSGSRLKRLAQAGTVHALVRGAAVAFTMGPRGRASLRSVGVPADRIRDLPYCCDLEPYLEVARTAGRRHRIVTLSQLIPRKRVDLVIDAFAGLADEFPDWDLVVGGAGPLAAGLARRVPAALGGRVEFPGFVAKSDQPAFYAAADLFVLASEEDGWGMVVPEAMASGLPVVSTTGVESAAEMLRDGGGVVVPPADGPALRRAMRRLMADPTLRATEGARARAEARRFGPAAIAAGAAADLRDAVRRGG